MIELIAKKPRASERQTVFVKIDGIEFLVGNVPIELPTDADILTWLNKNEDFYKFLILQNQYSEADWQRFKTEENTNLQAMQEWIEKGHKNKVQVGLTKAGSSKYGYIVIEKQEMEYRHPKWIGLKAKIEAAGIDSKTKELLKEIIK